MTDDSSRRDALRSISAAASLVLVTGRPSPRPSRVSSQEREVLRTLLAVERDRVATYDDCLAVIGNVPASDPLLSFQGMLEALAQHFRAHHLEHATQVALHLVEQGGADDVGAGQSLLPAGFRPTLQNIIALATNVEKAAAIAHGEAQRRLDHGVNARLVAAIGSVESQHFVVLDLLARGFVTPSATTANQPAAALAATARRLVPRAFVVTLGDAPGLDDERDLPFHDVSQ
ncbi:hypothetical protein LY474_13105 [Myxococcus stipitatus]|uniref:hypothetical protein n=1 Tax=Myxococcus stipitatus TaxID=83455 RepID=UPI001F3A4F63|nr:hypothetical protein [Myxococcus stipitatus]MCE9668756.1 hypothetical protein [Myxococcus stipitatus]